MITHIWNRKGEVKLNSKTKVIVILAVLVLAFAGLSKLTSNNVKTGSTCGGSTCTTAPTSQPSATQPSGSKASTGLPRLVDLGATTCVPCKMMSSVLDELSAEYKGKLSVEFIDINENSAAAQRYNIRAIPTQVFIDAAGKEFFRHEGYYPKEDILTKYKEHGIDLGKEK